MSKTITEETLRAFRAHLISEERCVGTMEKYQRDVRNLAAWLEGVPVSKELVAGWKAHLLELGYQPVTINSMLVAANVYLRFIGCADCRVKLLKLQRRTFRDRGRELSLMCDKEVIEVQKILPFLSGT